MNKLAFIDLDGVVANSDKRFELATVDGKIKWDIALSGEYVHLDTLIENVPHYLDTLEQRGYAILFLTSRPEHMREATEAWMRLHKLIPPAFVGKIYSSTSRLEMKPAEAQFVKTVKWKIDQLQEIAAICSVAEVLLVDDEPAICAELMNRAEEVAYKIVVCSSLAQACE